MQKCPAGVFHKNQPNYNTVKKNNKCKGNFIVKNDRGLHTRPSTEIVKCTGKFKSEIHLIYQKNHINAKSILGVLMLAATKGAKINIEAEGVDAQEAIKALIELANNQFNIHY